MKFKATNLTLCAFAFGFISSNQAFAQSKAKSPSAAAQAEAMAAAAATENQSIGRPSKAPVNQGRPSQAPSNPSIPKMETIHPRRTQLPNLPKVQNLPAGMTPRTAPVQLTPEQIAEQNLVKSGLPIACGNKVQKLFVDPPNGGRGRGVNGICMQLIQTSTNHIIWEGLSQSGLNLRRLPYKGGAFGSDIKLKSKQAGLIAPVSWDDHAGNQPLSTIVMAQMQVGVFGSIEYLGNGQMQASQFSASLYDPKTDTHTFNPDPLPIGKCVAWNEAMPPQTIMDFGAWDPNNLDSILALAFNIMFFSPFGPPLSGPTPPPSGQVLGNKYVKAPANKRCWLGGAYSAVQGLPIEFSWGPLLSLGAAYTINNGQLVDKEAEEDAQMEQLMLSMGSNPGESTLKYSGAATTDANGNFQIPYIVETISVGPFSVRRRGYRITKVHKVQSGFRVWQKIDQSGQLKPNKNGDCLIGKASVSASGAAIDISYKFKGSSC